MHKRHLLCCITILILLLSQITKAAVSLRVFSKDEGLYENNISKPRFYIQNFGTEPLSDFYCYYYFTIENGKQPQVEDFYTPDASISFEDLGSSNYRVKFLFSGITINPGQTLPNPDGEIIGLHYTDWSLWDKANDYSNSGTAFFVLNGNIPVYSSSGILIYGNDPGTPAIPPQPPTINTSTAGYAVLSSEYTDLRDSVEIKGGDVGSKVYIEAGCDVVVKGSLFSGRGMFLRERAHIYNDAAAVEEIREQNGIVVDGSKRSYAQLHIPSINLIPVTPGTRDTTVPNDGFCILPPGNYRDFHAYSRSTITLEPGNYVFNQFIIEPDVTIILKVADNERIDIKVSGEVRFSDRTEMLFERDTTFPYSINIYSTHNGQFFIGNNCKIYGAITAPASEVHVYSRTLFYGTIYGKRVVIEPKSTVCKPPVLLDLWHSEWAYSPPFSSSVFNYKAIVTDVTTTLIIKPVASTGSTILINGNSSDTLNLTSVKTDAAIKVSNPDQCGTTTYNINIEKSANYQIFVNDDSPCTPDNEDGLSWGTAFKNLQKGIDRATQEGKEIWVAEGVYKPTFRTDSLNPRSATFMIYSGIQIIGGYKGYEVNGEPQGSLYNTILSGDLSGNDDSISVWPPAIADTQYISDNVYHVVTMSENSNTSSIKLERLNIKGGVATGKGKDMIGAGVLNSTTSPTLEFVIITRNLADSSGAGVYDAGGIRLLKNCLIEKNVSIRGCGAGLFTENGNLEIDASVFYRNELKDTASISGGAGIYSINSTVSMVNTVFSKNNSQTQSGAIHSKNGFVKISSSTFSGNSSRISAECIGNENGTANIINSILWNDGDSLELAGDSITVNYSCIRDGFSGTGNISENPLFMNDANPSGTDGKFGTFDDGLFLSEGSPCINKGFADSNAPLTDIILTEREDIDIGAYEYFKEQDYDKVFGYLDPSGNFIAEDKIHVIDKIWHWWYVSIYAECNYAAVGQILVPKNKHTKKKSNIYTNFYSLDSLGNTISGLPPVRIQLYKVGERDGMLVFQTKTKTQGKPIVFVKDNSYHNWENNWAYVVCAKSSNFKAITPSSQF